MANSKIFKVNKKGFAEVRRLPALVQMEEDIAEDIAKKCNTAAEIDDGFRTSSRQGKGRNPRWRTTVITATFEAMYWNAKTNGLLRMLGVERAQGFVSKAKRG